MAGHVELALDALVPDESADILDGAERRQVEKPRPHRALPANEGHQALTQTWAEEAGRAPRRTSTDPAGFEDDESSAGAPPEKMIGRREAGQPGADDNGVGAEGGARRRRAGRRLVLRPDGRRQDHARIAPTSSARETDGDRRTRQIRLSTR
jgi:hypothetical protein